MLSSTLKVKNIPQMVWKFFLKYFVFRLVPKMLPKIFSLLLAYLKDFFYCSVVSELGHCLCREQVLPFIHCLGKSLAQFEYALYKSGPFLSLCMSEIIHWVNGCFYSSCAILKLVKKKAHLCENIVSYRLSLSILLTEISKYLCCIPQSNDQEIL